jgi:membrane-bound metal-dependent hydrolase YbcI (DUF457 family)
LPGISEHSTIGAGVGTSTYLLMCKYYGRKPEIGEALLSAGIGMFMAVAPDLLESAVDPNHRSFGHSVALGAGLAKLGFSMCGKDNKGAEELFKILSAVALASYLSHLGADGFTPSALPLLTGR